MRKIRLYLSTALPACLMIMTAAAQTTITGHVSNRISKEDVPAVSVTVKGTNTGTYTDDKGNFKLSTDQHLPVTLVFTSIGFEAQEVQVPDASKPVQVSFNPTSTLGKEVVVSATRLPEGILESPVSIERMNSQAIHSMPAPNFYENISNLKGVDLTTSSITFRTISTRGFNGSGNLRFNQLIDGMDNQAPGLNFCVGNVIGPTQLDIDNVELLSGASSALYGSGGMNGTLLMTSKNPFKYQGFSFEIKQGVMHVDSRQRSVSPYYDWAFRWGKKISEKFAFKISSEFLSAKDWQASDTRDLERNNVYSSIKSGDRQSDPNYDGVNVFGDEASASMAGIAQAALYPLASQLAQVYGRPPTYTEMVNYINSQPGNAQLQQLLPFAAGMQNSVFGGQLVSRTGYNEKDLVDYDSYNFKITGGLYYKITDAIEASLVGYWGTGTTVYTGADRYALKNLKMGQYKAEVKGKNWFLRAYTTQENSGDSYTATTAAIYINRAWRSDGEWFGLYSGTYAGARLQGATDAQAHAAARAAADQGRFLPGSTAFQNAFKEAISKPISEGGAKFADKTDMYHAEGQLNLTDYIKFADVLVGASFRQFDLNSNGTIFADTAGIIKINEYGGYVQVQKSLLNDFLKLTGSIRYDKNENFDGRFTPRATALIKVARDNHIRLSFQTAYRFPSTQDQWINLLTPATRLIGGLPSFKTFFHFDTSPAYTAESIAAYRATVANGTPNPLLLQQAVFSGVKPESMSSYEIGYRGLITRNFLVDVYSYYSIYKDFIARVAVGRGESGSSDFVTEATELASPFTTNNYSFVTNSDQQVKAWGYGISGEYRFREGYTLNANFSSDNLTNVPAGLVTFFNTPKYRFNLGVSDNKIAKDWGFSLMYRWQDKVYWEGTFGTGNIPAFGTLDAQVNYQLRSIKSVIKLGASNLLNHYYYSAFGNPQVGGVYYISFGYNIF